jgi:peroxiredoxin
MKFLIIYFLLIGYTINAQLPATTIPDFVFYKLDKSVFTKENITSNKKSVIIFFDATCEHCQKTLSFFNEHSKQLQNSRIYLISLNDKETIKNFLVKFAPRFIHDKNVTVLQDSKNEFISKFHPRKYPSMFLYSSSGKLLFYDDDDKKAKNLLQLISDLDKKHARKD